MTHYNITMPPRSKADKPAPLFSIITVTYNAQATIVPTLDSVDRQTCTHYEHLIIDGASTDNTLDIAREHPNSRRRVFSSPDNGIYDAMNKGIAMASGDYLVFLNSGDALHSPDTLQLIADAIINNGFPGVVYGQTQVVGKDRAKLADRHLTAPEKLTYESFAEGMVVCHQAFVALRRICDEYDLRYRFSADYEWCIRVLQHSRHNVAIFDEPLVDYLAGGMSAKNRRKSLVERFKIMCYYYGFFPTVARHLKFIPRYLRRSRLESKFASII